MASLAGVPDYLLQMNTMKAFVGYARRALAPTFEMARESAVTSMWI